MNKLLNRKVIFFVLIIMLIFMSGCNRAKPNTVLPETGTSVIEENEIEETQAKEVQKETTPQNENVRPSLYEAMLLVEPIREIEMVFVEGGSMIIQGQEITLDSFYISKYVLNAHLYHKIRNWAYAQGYLGESEVPWDSELPINRDIFWEDVIVYSNYLSLIEGLTPVYWREDRKGPILSFNEVINSIHEPPGSGIIYTVIRPFYIDWDADGYRLATEAEWEFAARGGKKSMGYRFAGSDNLEEVITRYIDREWDMGYILGQRKPNELGIHDMSSQASEWVLGPWTEFGELYPLHNPGRVSVFTFTEPFYLIQKGGNNIVDIRGEMEIADYIQGSAYHPHERIKIQNDRNARDFSRHMIKASVRFVRNVAGNQL